MKLISFFLIATCISYIVSKEIIKYNKMKAIKKLNAVADQTNKNLLIIIQGLDNFQDLIIFKNHMDKMCYANKRIFTDYKEKNQELKNAYRHKVIEIMNKTPSVFAHQSLIKSFSIN